VPYSSEEGLGWGVGCKVLMMHGAGKEHKNLEGLTVIYPPRFRANIQHLPSEEEHQKTF